MVYDLDQLEVFPLGLERPPEESCCFTFNAPDRKQEALLGMICILR